MADIIQVNINPPSNEQITSTRRRPFRNSVDTVVTNLQSTTTNENNNHYSTTSEMHIISNSNMEKDEILKIKNQNENSNIPDGQNQNHIPKDFESISVRSISEDDRDSQSSNSKIKDSTGDLKVCKICYEKSNNKDELLTPCNCVGSVKYIHKSCIKKWLSSRDIDITEAKCEICGTNYNIEYQDIYVLDKAAFSSFKLKNLIFCFFCFCLMFGVINFIYSELLRYNKIGANKKYTFVIPLTCAFFVLTIIFYFYLRSCTKKECYNLTDRKWEVLNLGEKKEEKPPIFLDDDENIEHLQNANISKEHSESSSEN